MTEADRISQLAQLGDPPREERPAMPPLKAEYVDAFWQQGAALMRDVLQAEQQKQPVRTWTRIKKFLAADTILFVLGYVAISVARHFYTFDAWLAMDVWSFFIFLKKGRDHAMPKSASEPKTTGQT